MFMYCPTLTGSGRVTIMLVLCVGVYWLTENSGDSTFPFSHTHPFHRDTILTDIRYDLPVSSSCLSAGRLAIGSGDSLIRLWNVNEGVSDYCVTTVWQGLKSKVTAVSFQIT